MKMCTKSLGLFDRRKDISNSGPIGGFDTKQEANLTHLDRNVDKANDQGVIVGTVAKNPFDKLNGKGQNRIAVRYNRPSLLKTWPRALNL